MKGVKYNCILDSKYNFEGLLMCELVEILNDKFNQEYNGLIKVNSTKIYNLIKRPKTVSKNLRNLLIVEYASK